MAKKSKTQRAKAQARRAEKKLDAAVEATEEVAEGAAEETSKKVTKAAKSTTEVTKEAKKEVKKDTTQKKEGFISRVRSELKRVTWPSRQDVIQWSIVVVAALIFFSLFVFVLDNWVVTPLLVWISGLGAS